MFFKGLFGGSKKKEKADTDVSTSSAVSSNKPLVEGFAQLTDLLADKKNYDAANNKLNALITVVTNQSNNYDESTPEGCIKLIQDLTFVEEKLGSLHKKITASTGNNHEVSSTLLSSKYLVTEKLQESNDLLEALLTSSNHQQPKVLDDTAKNSGSLYPKIGPVRGGKS